MGVGGLSLLLLCLEAPGVTPAGIFSHVCPSVRGQSRPRNLPLFPGSLL